MQEFGSDTSFFPLIRQPAHAADFAQADDAETRLDRLADFALAAAGWYYPLSWMQRGDQNAVLASSTGIVQPQSRRLKASPATSAICAVRIPGSYGFTWMGVTN